MLKLFVDNVEIETNRIQFSDGAVSYNLKDFPQQAKKVVISVDPNFKVGGLLDELTQLMSCRMNIEWDTEFVLNIPYLPYARADRRFSENGNGGLQSFLFKLADLPIDRLVTVDPHNEQALRTGCSTFIDVEYTSQLDAFREVVKREHILPSKQWDVVIAPDKGAKDKAKTIADYYKLPLVCCTKERDPATGKLSNPVVPEPLEGKRVLIVDDLMDGGYTYIQLAQELYKHGATHIDLYVTHLIASKGLNVLTNSIHKLYTYHTCCGYITMQDVYKFNEGEI